MTTLAVPAPTAASAAPSAAPTPGAPSASPAAQQQHSGSGHGYRVCRWTSYGWRCWYRFS
ncbi:MAG TPA: hypothetical protein VHR88_12485 [Solirubrobacteraceae bacterium]|nr:hypothetical protein [Solirubrobacteraceae bacterium]